MIEDLVTIFIKYQFKIGIIQREDFSIYKYGYTLMIEVVFNICVSILLGVFLNAINEVFLSLCMFIPLRSFCGGYHAKKAWQCFILSNLSILMILILSKLLIYYNTPLFIYFIAEVALGSVIVYLSPIESENKKINFIEKETYIKYIKKILIIEIVLGIVFAIFGNQKIFSVLFGVYIIQVVSLLTTFKKH